MNTEKTISTTMKSMVINHFGDTDVFEAARVATPAVKSGHVRVKIETTSVNTVDTMIRQSGADLPFAPELPAILGMDFAGVVVEIADDVSDYKVGDEVYGCAGGLADLQGTLAEFIAADANLIAHKPKTLNMRQAAALPLVAITAYEGIQRAGIKKGDKVLVHGGAGGVGHVAVQLAKYFGADVYATGSGDDKLSLIEQLGATAINYRESSVEQYVEAHTQGKGFDVVYDSIGGENMLNSFDAATLNGQVVSTVSLLELDLTTAHIKGLSLHVVFMLIPMLHNVKRQEHAEILKNLAQIADAGQLTPVLDQQTFSMAQAGDAHARLASGNALGKVVIDI